ncbi:MAG: AsmA family protein, partial [Deltaproteobacteria bacterium]|nr:AsmA family protein [Deltaproteobacteria bacterium]
FTTGAIEPGERFDLDLHFQLAATQPAVTGTFALKGGVLIASSLNAVEISAAELLLEAKGDTVPAGKMSVSLATDIAIDLEAQTLSMPAVVLDTLGMNITGNISATKISGDNPQFSGVFTVADFVPRELIKALGQENPVTTDSSVLGNANARLEWTASAKDFSADALQIRLDDTSVNGTARVAQFDAPEISFSLSIDQFDLDRYLPPVTEGAEAAETIPEATSPAKGEAGGELPVEALRALNLNGKLNVGSLKAFNLRSMNVEIQIKAKDGLLRINPAGAQLYNGEIRSDITFDVRKQTPRFSLVNDVVKVQAGPLLHDLTGDEKLLGTATSHASLTGSGIKAEAIKQSLNGKASFSFTDGAIKGVNIAALIRNARAKLKGQSAPKSTEPNQTDFAELRGTAVITNGLIRNDDLSMSSPLLRISGKGEVSLPKETIDYTLTTKIVGTLEGQGGTALGELKGVSIPVHVAGTFSKPTYTPDLGAALSDVAKEKLQEKVEEQQQKIQEKLGKELQDKLLKGLFD